MLKETGIQFELILNLVKLKHLKEYFKQRTLPFQVSFFISICDLWVIPLVYKV